MAVETPKATETEVGHPGSQGAGGRRMVLGTNVLVGTALVIGIVVVLQLLAYQIPKRWDMTRSGVNSLGEGTENLLHALTINVTLTSLYFETALPADEALQQAVLRREQRDSPTAPNDPVRLPKDAPVELRKVRDGVASSPR